jgi:hypothetical protein
VLRLTVAERKVVMRDVNTAVKERNGTIIRLKDIKPVEKGRLIYDKQASPITEALDMNVRLKHVDAAYNYVLQGKESLSRVDMAVVVFLIGWFLGLCSMASVMRLMGIF